MSVHLCFDNRVSTDWSMLMLYRVSAQNQMYESDFKKERADRQKARNELHTLRHQLSKQKTHTTGQVRQYEV